MSEEQSKTTTVRPTGINELDRILQNDVHLPKAVEVAFHQQVIRLEVKEQIIPKRVLR